MTGRPAWYLGLLRDPKVRADLPLNAAQNRTVESVMARIAQAEARMMPQASNRAGTQEPPGPAVWMWAGQELERVQKAGYAEIWRALVPAQKARLEQIRLQSPGVLRQPDPELVQALGLTPDQVSRLGEIVNAHQARVLERFPTEPTTVELRQEEGPGADGTGYFRSRFERRETVLTPAQMQQLAERNAAILAEERQSLDAVLTPDQRATLARLRGRPLGMR